MIIVVFFRWYSLRILSPGPGKASTDQNLLNFPLDELHKTARYQRIQLFLKRLISTHFSLFLLMILTKQTYQEAERSQLPRHGGGKVNPIWNHFMHYDMNDELLFSCNIIITFLFTWISLGNYYILRICKCNFHTLGG